MIILAFLLEIHKNGLYILRFENLIAVSLFKCSIYT